MYYYISGRLVKTDSACAVVDNNGIAYIINTSTNTLGKISGKDECRLYTYLSIRDDAQELFGFYDEEELVTFRLLLGVSGIGPRAALAILSVLTPERLAAAVSSGDTKAITAASGVGKKSAERVVLELKDKLSAFASPEVSDASNYTAAEAGGNRSEALNALIVLGYSRQEAARALSDIDCTGMEIDDIIRAALKKLF